MATARTSRRALRLSRSLGSRALMRLRRKGRPTTPHGNACGLGPQRRSESDWGEGGGACTRGGRVPALPRTSTRSARGLGSGRDGRKRGRRPAAPPRGPHSSRCRSRASRRSAMKFCKVLTTSSAVCAPSVASSARASGTGDRLWRTDTPEFLRSAGGLCGVERERWGGAESTY